MFSVFCLKYQSFVETVARRANKPSTFITYLLVQWEPKINLTCQKLDRDLSRPRSVEIVIHFC